MSENENNAPADDKLNPTKPVGIQEGKKSILSGGRRLTKLPMVIAFVIGIVVVGLILITLVQAGKKDVQQQDTMQDGGPGDSTGAPVDLFAGDKKSGAVDPLKEQQTGKLGENCLTAVLDNQGNPVMNPDGTPKQVPCVDPTQVTDPNAQGPQIVEGSAEDFENKRRLLELDRIRQKNDLAYQREQQKYQEQAKEESQRMQAMYDRQTALAGVLNASSTVNGGGRGAMAMPTGAGGSLSGLLPGGRSGGDAGGMPGELDPYDTANGQTKKQSWADQDRNKEVYLNKALVDKISDYEVKAGTVIPGILITGMNSDLPGQIIARFHRTYMTVRLVNIC